MAVPVQEFQIGQRVRPKGETPFVISDIRIRFGCIRSWRIYYSAGDTGWHETSELTLAPERPPYVPNERLVIGRDNAPRASIGYLNSVCRCETDDEMAARHTAERAAYDARKGGE